MTGSFTENVKGLLREAGWEIYTPKVDSIHEWWWIPARHKDYWHNQETGVKSDQFMFLNDAVSWQMMVDRKSNV